MTDFRLDCKVLRWLSNYRLFPYKLIQKSMHTTSFMLCRTWLAAIALDYGVRAGLTDPPSTQRAAHAAAQDAVRMLTLAPWHFRLLVGTVELFASLWCMIYRFFTCGRSSPMAEMTAFEKTPIIAAALLRLYRSLVALSWFEQPEALALFGCAEMAEARQERFRRLRNATV